MDFQRTQLLSVAAKGITSVLGVVQSIIIIRLLSKGDFGLLGLVMSIGNLIGVAQHLGIVEGTIREVAISKSPAATGKVFWASHIVRQTISLPLSVALIVLAPFIARWYGHQEITLYLQIFAGVLFMQGIQDVFGATLTGLKKFTALYAIQTVTAVTNIFIFWYLTWQFGVAGFFTGMIIASALMVVLFWRNVRGSLTGHLQLPTVAEAVSEGKRLLRLGVQMHLARIFSLLWQRLPMLALGGLLAAEALGELNVAVTFGVRMMIIAQALSEVNLSWMSSLFQQDRATFQYVGGRNMQRLTLLMLVVSAVLVFFSPEILQYIIGADYLPALPLILTMVSAFFFLSLIDIGTSSIFAAANQPRLRVMTHGVATILSGLLIGLVILRGPDAYTATLAALTGAVAAYLVMIVVAAKRFAVHMVTRELAVTIVLFAAAVGWLTTGPGLAARLAVFWLLGLLTIWLGRRRDLLPSVAKLRSYLPFTRRPAAEQEPIICFAGAAYDLPQWTNRQHVMSRLSQTRPVLYVEPRVWIVRYLTRHWRQPQEIGRFFQRLLWYERQGTRLYVKAQWNLLPGSREHQLIARLNHNLNSWHVRLVARLLGMTTIPHVLWLYDTEAAQYLADFPRAAVVYDCVDDHAAQAGVDRNSARVAEEERTILQRAALVTVTSRRLFAMKQPHHPNVQLVLNAGDVQAFSQAGAQTTIPPDIASIGHPRFGSVGALDSYKVDIDLLTAVAQARPAWQFVFIGHPVLEGKRAPIEQLNRLPNVHVLGPRHRTHVPAYAAAFDVCMIPYRQSRYNEASFPLKFWECMATGKPVIAAGLPELEPYQDVIALVRSADEFIAAGEAALHDLAAGSNQRRALAQGHDWTDRAARLEQLLQRTIAQANESNIEV